MSRGFQPVYTPVRRSGPPGWLLGLIGLGVLVVIGAVAFVLLSGNTPSPSPSPTPTAVAATDAPTTAPTPQLAAQIEAVMAQVPPIRGLQPTSVVPYEFISRDQFRNDLIELNDEDVAPEIRAAEERLLKRLGLLPDDADLNAMLLDLYGAQVAAFYRPDNGRFYIIERDQAFGAMDRMFVAHEYTHALQDQAFDLEGTRVSDPAQGDAALAQLGVIEGDATLSMQLWALENLTLDELFDLLTLSLSGLDEQTLEGMPLVLRRQLEFPYSDGFAFVSDIHTVGGFDAVDNALHTPPTSTEQILHPEKYAAGEAPVPLPLDDMSGTLGAGWSRTYQQTFGELGIQILATGGEVPDVLIPGLPVDWPHAEVAAGWGGDRLNMYEGPNGAWAIVWATAWDSQADQSEFSARVSELSATFAGLSSTAPTQLQTEHMLITAVASDEATVAAIQRQFSDTN